MLKKSHVYSIFLLLLVLFTSSAAWAATITGTVANSTGKTGRVYVVAELVSDGSRSFGTTIQTEGSFTISGVIPERYVVRAFLDEAHYTSLGTTGIRHANDPHGVTAPFTVPVGATTVAAGTVALTLPDPAVALTVPEVTVYGGSGVNYVKWKGTLDTDFNPVAEYYTVEWNTTPTAADGQIAWVASGFDDSYLHSGGSSSLYYRVTAHLGSTSAPSAWIQVVSPAATTGSITGTVSLPGSGVAIGPLFVVAVNERVDPPLPPVVRVVRVTTTTSPTRYTIASVPSGTYNIFAFRDQNNNGKFDVGDAGMLPTNAYVPLAIVDNAQASVPPITLEAGSAATIITTGHGQSDSTEWFNLVLTAQSMAKRLVAVTLTGPQLGQPVTLGLEKNGRFHTRIPMMRQTAGQVYSARLDFADGNTETVSEQVTDVLTGFANPVTPVGNILFTASPTFEWTAPAPAPTVDYLYSVWLSNNTTGAKVWSSYVQPSSVTSIPYGGPPLENGTTYKWIMNITDANGNMAAREVVFTPTSSAAISSFTPAGGRAGTEVTITGVNFPVTPAPTVLFGTLPATVTESTTSSITAIVPVGAISGKITVNALESEKTFYVGEAVTINGRVLDSRGNAVEAANVELLRAIPTVSTTTNAQGNFTLGPVFPGQDVTLLIAKNGFVPTYSVDFPVETNNKFLTGQTLDLTRSPFHLYTDAELTAWGVTPGRGMIVGHILEDKTFTGGAGATVTTTPSYPVRYYNGTAVTGTSTAANGTFMVMNVPPQAQDWVTATAQKAGWIFYSSGSYPVNGWSVTEGPILGDTLPPTITGLNPTKGKRGSSVRITGQNFSPVPSENQVQFGEVNPVTAVVTAATATELTVTVPPTAVTSVVVVTKAGMKSTSSQLFEVTQTLTVTITGNGTVNSNPLGINCGGGTGCTSDFPLGETVTLFPTAEGDSTFSGWSGPCTGTGVCEVTMAQDVNATATFTSGSTIRIGTVTYPTLAAALEAAAPGSTIEMQALLFPENDVIVGKAVRINGGYDSTFDTRNGFTTLNGRLFVGNGLLRVDRLKVR